MARQVSVEGMQGRLVLKTRILVGIVPATPDDEVNRIHLLLLIGIDAWRRSAPGTAV